MKYRRKPETVEAFLFSPDAEYTAPEWFAEAVRRETVVLDRAINDGAVHVYGCTIVTEAGKLKAKNGDYVVKGDGGGIFPVRAKIFERQYEREA